MLTCTSCGTGNRLQISQSGNPGAPVWRAECDDCGTTWDFDD